MLITRGDGDGMRSERSSTRESKPKPPVDESSAPPWSSA